MIKTKRFFNLNVDKRIIVIFEKFPELHRPCLKIVGNPLLSEVVRMGISALHWFFEFGGRKEIKGNEEEMYIHARRHYLNMIYVTQKRLIPCQHYITNHLIEDWRNYGPLGFLLCEGSEACHSQDRHWSRFTMNGMPRRRGGKNSWNSVLTNRCCLLSLCRSGVIDRFVFSFFQLTADGGRRKCAFR